MIPRQWGHPPWPAWITVSLPDVSSTPSVVPGAASRFALLRARRPAAAAPIRQLSSRGAVMKLAGINASIRDLFRITNLLAVFDVHDNVDQAIRDFPRRAAS